MVKRPYEHLTNEDLTRLRLRTHALVTQVEPMLGAGRLRADDWQAPTDTLHWLGWQLDVEAEARAGNIDDETSAGVTNIGPWPWIDHGPAKTE